MESMKDMYHRRSDPPVRTSQGFKFLNLGHEDLFQPLGVVCGQQKIYRKSIQEDRTGTIFADGIGKEDFLDSWLSLRQPTKA